MSTRFVTSPVGSADSATHRLPQLDGRVFISEAGFETDLVFNHGIDLPHFATFPLLESPEHRDTIRRYYQAVIDIGRRDGTGVVIETLTWRAHSDWGALLGYDAGALERVNRDAVTLFVELRAANPDTAVVVSGNLGPRGDGYAIADAMSASEAAKYHHPQVRSLAAAGPDLVSAFTINYADEATGIVMAAVSEDVPVVISFTVETDGRLPSGQSLAAAIEQVDAATDGAAAYFMVNCAHPSHFLHVLDTPGPWYRLRGVRANASTKSHEELDNSTELDRGDETALVDGYLRIADRLPHLAVTGGCCGTDLAHLDLISAAFAGRPSTRPEPS
ncbi:MAG: homocysteine S-methyltransferase family protein [Acidimicrobiales bacterium]